MENTTTRGQGFTVISGGKDSQPKPDHVAGAKPSARTRPEGIPEGMTAIELPPELGMLLLLALMSGKHGRVGVLPRDN
jgi:hypothetical protein